MTTTAHFKDIRLLIQEELRTAKESIQIAVAWFTDKKIFDLLLEKASENVSVTLIIRNDVINIHPAGIKWQEFIDKPDATFYFSKEHPHLHHKFCLIDGKTVISGSYNWTYAAQRNHENVIISSQAELVKSFRQAYSSLLDYSREVKSISAMAVEAPPATDESLQYQAAMEVEFQVQTAGYDSNENDYERLVLAAGKKHYLKEYASAEELLQKALLSKPDGAEAHYLLAVIYWRTSQFNKSVSSAKLAEFNGINNAALWNAFGLAYEGLKKYKEAIEYYDRSIGLEPSIATWYLNKCMALDGWGRETLGDKAASETVRVASEEIRKYKNGGDDYRLMKAYVERAALRKDKPEARKDAQAAREIFDMLPEDERDLHDLDDIKNQLK